MCHTLLCSRRQSESEDETVEGSALLQCILFQPLPDFASGEPSCLLPRLLPSGRHGILPSLSSFARRCVPLGPGFPSVLLTDVNQAPNTVRGK